MRTGDCGQGYQVSVQNFTDVLAGISKTCQLVGGGITIYQTELYYIIPIQRLIQGFRQQLPSSIPQLEVPKEVTEMSQQLDYLTGNPKLQATGDLSIISFY